MKFKLLIIKLFDLDVDECQESDPCHNRATCINLAGSYKCKCKPGWTGQTCSIGTNSKFISFQRHF